MRREQKAYDVALDVSPTTELIVGAVGFVNPSPGGTIPDDQAVESIAGCETTVLFERSPRFTITADGPDVESRLGCVTAVGFDRPEPGFTTPNNPVVESTKGCATA